MCASPAPVASGGTDLLGAIVDAVDAAVCIIDFEGKIVHWNPAAAALTGISADRVITRPFCEALLFPDDIGKWKREFHRISAGMPSRKREAYWRNGDGSRLALKCSWSVIRDSSDAASYFVCTVTDSPSREVLNDRAGELKDISRFLHDTISQDLVALSFNISELEARVRDGPMGNHARLAVDMVDRCCRDIRVISYMLAPPFLSETTLQESIELFAACVREETGLTITVDLGQSPRTIAPEARVLVFAAVQSWVARGISSHSKPDLCIRLAKSESEIELDLEAILTESESPLPAAPLSGWSLFRSIARALGGDADIAQEPFRASASIRLPQQSWIS
jgi:PAS domain S-box-containing protein